MSSNLALASLIPYLPGVLLVTLLKQAGSSRGQRVLKDHFKIVFIYTAIFRGIATIISNVSITLELRLVARSGSSIGFGIGVTFGAAGLTSISHAL